MKIVVAPDSFKECLSADKVARAMARGVLDQLPDAEVVERPMADGGEGTLEALLASLGGKKVRRTVTGPLGDKVKSCFGWVDSEKLAIVEMARASGLDLVPSKKRNPLKTTTRGTGELIRAALEKGAETVLVTIGGSATVDGGTGMAAALGYRLLDDQGNDLPDGGGALGRLMKIDASTAHPRLSEVDVRVACDVDNVLCGKRGAAAVYGPQKGATPEMVKRLDAGLQLLAEVIHRDLGVRVMDLAGAGAAGGLGAGLVAFCGAGLASGVDLVADAVGLDDALHEADLVLTGEGQLDGTSGDGKVPGGVARRGAARGVPVVAVCGSAGSGADDLLKRGLASYFSICPGPVPEQQAIDDAANLIRSTTRRIVSLYLAGVNRPRSTTGKVLGLEALVEQLKVHRKQGRRIAWTNGCFDILHPGHILYLGQARRTADMLVVGLNSDASVRRNKGEGRPVNDQDHRGAVLSELDSVDYVTVFDDDSPIELIRALQPDVYVKGGDYTIDTINQQERHLVESYGGRIVLTDAVRGTSTTGIIDRIKKG